MRLQKRAPGEATPPRAAAVGAAAGGGSGAGSAAAVEATRALGFMEAKRQAGAWTGSVAGLTALLRPDRRLPAPLQAARACCAWACCMHPRSVHTTAAIRLHPYVPRAGGSGALVCEAHATDHALTPTDQHLVMGTSAFWHLVGPADCALRAHFHEKVRCGCAVGWVHTRMGGWLGCAC